jgi:hypothetical protein
MPDPCTAGLLPLGPRQIQPPPWYWALSHASLKPLTWHTPYQIPTPRPCCQIHNHRDPRHPAMLDPSSEPTTIQALLSPSYTWDDRTPVPRTLHSLGPAGLQLCVEWLEPHPAGTDTSLAWDSRIHQFTRNPAHWVELAPALQAFQITTLPGSHLGFH